jgi:GTP-binding protein
MLQKQRLIMISKADMLDDELKVELEAELKKSLKKEKFMIVSSVAQQGLKELKDELWKILNE